VDENEEEEEKEDFATEWRGGRKRTINCCLYVVVIPVLFSTTYHTTLVSS